MISFLSAINDFTVLLTAVDILDCITGFSNELDVDQSIIAFFTERYFSISEILFLNISV